MIIHYMRLSPITFLSVLSLVCLTGCAGAVPVDDHQDSSHSSQMTNADIIPDLPKPYTVVESPLTISGKARGTWYFEASFPVRLFDGNGNEIAVTPAQAEGEWMTEDFVPYTATLEFAKPVTTMGTLVLQKDNPSGIPEYDAHIVIPVLFQ